MQLSYQIHNQLAVISMEVDQADLLPSLVKTELMLAEQGCKQIELHINVENPQIAQRLARLHYKQTTSFIWQKEITYRKSVRLSVTEQCNFHCFFCHGEGVEMSVKREKIDQKRLFAVISELAEQGYEDFTFTGGEPLLNWRLIEACLDHMQNIGYLPEVTIVTNGERLNARMIARLKAYPGIY